DVLLGGVGETGELRRGAEHHPSRVEPYGGDVVDQVAEAVDHQPLRLGPYAVGRPGLEADDGEQVRRGRGGDPALEVADDGPLAVVDLPDEPVGVRLAVPPEPAVLEEVAVGAVEGDLLPHLLALLA